MAPSAQGRILVVDDERFFRQQLGDLLGRRGFEVDTAAGGESAVRKVSEGDYDVVLLDLVMPKLSGLEVLQEMLQVRPHISVVIVTSYGSIESTVAAMQMGAYHYLTKPIDEEALDFVVRNSLERSRLLSQNASLREEALSDDLTSSFNRRFLELYLEEEIERSRRYNHPFSILFFDLDRLKDVNDAHGHMTGSEVLREVSTLVQGRLRKIDKLFRFGGDEFVVSLPETDEEGAYRAANRLRRAVRSHRFLAKDGLNLSLTASFGIATFPRDGGTKEELIRRADAAMYRVKGTTRDGVGAVTETGAGPAEAR